MGINIDFKLLPMKVHYFLFNAGTGAVIPFMPVFARQLGFSTFVVGIIYYILPILGLISKPLFGAIADRYQRHKLMFVIFIFLTVGAFTSVKFIPPILKSTKVDYHCNDGMADLKYCPTSIDHCAADLFINNINQTTTKEYTFDLRCEVKEDWMWELICKEWENSTTDCIRDEINTIHLKSLVKHDHINKLKDNGTDCLFFVRTNTTYINGKTDPKSVICPKTTNFPHKGSFRLTCTGSVDNADVMDLIVEQSVNDNNYTSYPQFWYFFGALAVSWIGMAVVVSVGDAICFHLLGKRHELYGHQRLWGAIGFGTFTLIAGVWVDYASGQKTYKNYTVIFYLMAAALVPNTIVSTCLEFKPNKISSSIIRDIGKLFRSARVVVFFLWCVVCGMCTGVIWNFLFWFLEDLAEQHGDCNGEGKIKTLQGLVSIVQSFGGELPFFFISGWFITKLGHINSMTLVLFVMGIRLCLYSFLTNPWWVLPIELTQGMTFGICYTAMAMYANVVAPNGTAATLQGLVGAIFEGVGVSTGSFICGYLMDVYTGRIAFRIFGVSAICLSFVHYFVQKFLDNFGTKHDYRSAANAIPNDDFQMLEDNDFY
ncbi:major facilitator superfamily domain-containing protein 6 isoform X2 [Sitodiplosis mosellana]|uniref:major facilitator superfamily domain-containing protein 6 isoform X2 n=1 Tax=Sitodiplosis mosellana TaxID=263140 RepID=UPI002443CE10|nr:major facilitator superfamily domain-containing protein 6 isoform X2 [Sitodiplosis mosellana]XP_055319818.1 major facilitator superfamily domain-containing protein 6 isoform X2 [Sitodiplosis mosellana]